MSIVAERAVRLQQAVQVKSGRRVDRPAGGLAEEVERQEREDDARGFEPEAAGVDGPVPGARLQGGPDDLIAVAGARAWTRREGPRYVRSAPGHGPDGLQLRPGEDPRMSPEQAVWLEELYRRFGRLVRSMVNNRLLGQGVEFEKVAQWRDDLVQQVWLSVARGQGGLLRMQDADVADWRVKLHFLVKQAVGEHWRRQYVHQELATDWVDVANRQMDPVAPPMVDLEGTDELTARCDELLAGLSEQMRTVVVELICFERTTEMVAELLEMSPAVVNRLSQRALRRLRGVDEPTPARLEDLSPEHRRVLESLPVRARAVLLLRIAGVSVDAIADHMDGSVRTIYKQLKTYLPLVEAGTPLSAQEQERAQRYEDRYRGKSAPASAATA